MASVLRRPTVESTRILDGRDPLLLEPAWQEMLHDAAARARQEGFEEGRLAARQEATETVTRATTSLQDAVESVRAEAERLRDDQSDELVRLAVRLVENLTGELRIEPTQVLARLHAALDELDGSDLEVRVSPDDAEVVGAGLAGDVRVTVVGDPALRPGEARISGMWCDADLTFTTALEVMKEALGV